MVLRLILLLQFLLFSATLGAQECDSTFEKINPWVFGQEIPKIKPHHVLPENFVKLVEEAQGPIQIRSEYRFGSDLYFEVGTAEYKTFMNWAFFKNTADPESMIIERLRLENPLVKKGTGDLHNAQLNKGLPSEVFRYARDQIFEIIKLSGKKKLVSKSSQNYTVYMLYQKMVGMKPKSAEGKAFSELMDKYYSFGRKHLPEEYKFKSLNDFTDVLGDYYGSKVSGEARDMWKVYTETGVLNPELQLIQNLEGNMIGFLYPNAPLNKSKIHFVTDIKGKSSIIEFKDAVRVPGLMELELILP